MGSLIAVIEALNLISTFATKVGLSWAQFGAVVNRARAENRPVTIEDIQSIKVAARGSLDRLSAAIAEAKGDEPPPTENPLADGIPPFVDPDEPGPDPDEPPPDDPGPTIDEAGSGDNLIIK